MPIDWTHLYEQYKGLWVALEDDEKTVIASGKTAKEAYDKAVEKGKKLPILTKVPKELVTYIGPSFEIPL